MQSSVETTQGATMAARVAPEYGVPPVAAPAAPPAPRGAADTCVDVPDTVAVGVGVADIVCVRDTDCVGVDEGDGDALCVGESEVDRDAVCVARRGVDAQPSTPTNVLFRVAQRFAAC
jgi:hypothetical protein